MARLASTKATVSVRDSARIVKTARNKAERKARLALKVSEIQPDFAARLVRLIRAAFTDHRVTQALLGFHDGAQNGDDLMAEFGLTLDTASEGLEAVEEAITDKDNIKLTRPKVVSTPRSSQVTIGAHWYNTGIESTITTDSRGTYISETERGEQEVPWLSWSIKSAGKMVTNWDIIYNLNSAQVEASRSGNALMISESRREWSGPYFVPDIVKPTRGSNWVHEALISIEKEAAKDLERSIRKRLQLRFTRALR